MQLDLANGDRMIAACHNTPLSGPNGIAVHKNVYEPSHISESIALAFPLLTTVVIYYVCLQIELRYIKAYFQYYIIPPK